MTTLLAPPLAALFSWPARESAAKLTAASWPSCLLCACPKDCRFNNNANVCTGCWSSLPRERRKGLVSMVEAWRKWHKRGCYVQCDIKAFGSTPPSPWAYIVYRLLVECGLRTPEPDESRQRVDKHGQRQRYEGRSNLGVCDLLGVDAATVRAVLAGATMSAAVKWKLLENAKAWLREAKGEGE